MKKVMVASCSHSQGRPSVRVAMSQTTVTVKPAIAIPHRIISTCSSGSSARHFRWRWASETSEMAALLLDVADQPEDLDRMRSEVLRDPVLHRRGDLLEAGLVDLGYDLHAHLLELGARLALELECARGLDRVHGVG